MRHAPLRLVCKTDESEPCPPSPRVNSERKKLWIAFWSWRAPLHIAWPFISTSARIRASQNVYSIVTNIVNFYQSREYTEKNVRLSLFAEFSLAGYQRISSRISRSFWFALHKPTPFILMDFTFLALDATQVTFKHLLGACRASKEKA